MKNLVTGFCAVALIMMSCQKKEETPLPTNNDNLPTHSKGATIVIEKNGATTEINALSVTGGNVVSGSQYAFVGLGYVNSEGDVTAMTIDIRFGSENPQSKTYNLTDDGFNIGQNAYIIIRESTGSSNEYISKLGTVKIHQFTEGNGKIYFELDGTFAEVTDGGDTVVNNQVKISGYVKG